jgi:hypothetical protein
MIFGMRREALPSQHAIGLKDFFPSAVFVLEVPQFRTPDHFIAFVRVKLAVALEPHQHYRAVVITFDDCRFLHIKKLRPGGEDGLHLLTVVIG